MSPAMMTSMPNTIDQVINVVPATVMVVSAGMVMLLVRQSLGIMLVTMLLLLVVAGMGLELGLNVTIGILPMPVSDVTDRWRRGTIWM